MKVCSPFTGLAVPRVAADGTLRTVALLNTTIDAQGPVRLTLRKMPKGQAVWRELRREPVVLSVVRKGDESVVTVPSIGAWNGGYVEFFD